MKDEIKLRPCPHCGKSVAIITTIKECEGCSNFEACDDCYMVAVVCDFNAGGCGSASGYRMTPEEAAELWNQRAEERPTAHFVRGNAEKGQNEKNIYCSACGGYHLTTVGNDATVEKGIELLYNDDEYCRKCGAKMERPQEVD